MADSLNLDFSNLMGGSASMDTSQFDKAMLDMIAKIKTLRDAIATVGRGNDISKYYLKEEQLIDAATEAARRFNQELSETSAKELVNTVNALQGSVGVGEDLQRSLKGAFDYVSSAAARAKSMVGEVVGELTPQNFEKWFQDLPMLESTGLNVVEILQNAGNKVQEYADALDRANQRIAEMEQLLREAQDSSGLTEANATIEEQGKEIDDLNDKLSVYTSRAKETFDAFLKLHNLDAYAFNGEHSDKMLSYLSDVQSGALSAEDAIAKVKGAFSYLLEEEAKASKAAGGAASIAPSIVDGDWDSFSAKLEEILNQIASVSAQIRNLQTNGLTANTQQLLESLSSISQTAAPASEGLQGIGSGLQELITALSNMSGNSRELGILFGNLRAIGGEGFKIPKSILYIRDLLQGIDGFKNVAALSMLNSVQWEKLSQLKLSQASIAGLSSLLTTVTPERLERMKTLSELDWTKLNGLHVPAASLKSLADYLPDIAKVKVSNLEKLAAIDWNNINNIKFTKSTAQNLLSLAEAAKAMNNLSSSVGSKTVGDMSLSDKAYTDALLQGVRLRTSAELLPNTYATSAKTAATAADLVNKIDAAMAQLGSQKTGDGLKQYSTTISDLRLQFQQLTEAAKVDEEATQRLIDRQNKLSKESSAILKTMTAEQKKYNAAPEAEQQRIQDLINRAKAMETAMQGSQLSADQLSQYEAALVNIKKEHEEYTAAVVNSTHYIAQSSKEQVDAVAKLNNELKRSQDFLDKNNAGEGTAEYDALATNVEQLRQMQAELNSEQYQGTITAEQYNAALSNNERLLQQAAAAAQANGTATHYVNLETKEGNALYSKLNTTLRQTRDYLENNTARTTTQPYQELQGAYEELIELSDTLRNGGKVTADQLNTALDRMNGLLLKNKDAAHGANEGFRGLRGTVHDLVQQLGRYASATYIFMAAVRQFKQMISVVTEMDTAFNQLKIVTGASEEEMKSFERTTVQIAKQLGKSVTDITGSVETFSRLGYSLPDASELAKYATILSNVASVSTDEATTGLTSIIKGFGMNVSDAEHVAGVLIDVGQKYAVSASEIMTAFEKSGAALNATGVSFEESAGLIAAANASIQNANTVGTALKTISARIRKSVTELEELGEDTSDIANGFSKYAGELKQLTGFDIIVDGTTDTFKNLYEIMDGIADVWDRLSDTQQARVAEILGGTRQLQVVSSIIGNWSDAEKAYATAVNESNVAMQAQSVYAESIQNHIEQFKAKYQELARDVFSSDLLKFGIDGGRVLITVIDGLVKAINFLGGTKTVLLGIASALTLIYRADLARTVRTITEFASTHSILDLLKSALTGVSTGIKGVTASALTMETVLPGIMLALTAVTAVISGINNAIEENKRRIREAGDAAAENSKKISDAAKSAIEAADAYEAGTLSKEDFNKVSQDYFKVLDIEADKVDELIDKYGSYANAIRAISEEKIKQSIPDLQSAYAVALEDLQKKASTIGSYSLYYGVTYGAMGENLFNGGANQSPEEVIKDYDKLAAAMREVAKESGYDSRTYKYLNDLYQEITPSITAYKERLDKLNSSLATAAVLEKSRRDQLPKTVQEFQEYRKSILDAAIASGEFAGSNEDIKRVIDDTLRGYSEFTGFYTAISDAMDAVNESAGRAIPQITKYTDVLSFLKSGYEALNKATEDMKDGGGVSPDTISALAGVTEDYVQYLYDENGIVKLNVEAWKEYINTTRQTSVDGIRETIALLEQENAELAEKIRLAEEEQRNVTGKKYNELASVIDVYNASIEKNNDAIKENELLLTMYTNLADDVVESVQEMVDVLSFDDMVSDLGKIESGIKGVVSAMEKLEEGTALTTEELASLALQYPELLKNSDLFTTGSIEGQRALLEATLDSYEQEYDGLIDQKIAELEVINQFLSDQIELEQQKKDKVIEIKDLENNGKLDSEEDYRQLLQDLRDLEGKDYVTYSDGVLTVNKEMLEDSLKQENDKAKGTGEIWKAQGNMIVEATAKGLQGAVEELPKYQEALIDFTNSAIRGVLTGYGAGLKKALVAASLGDETALNQLADIGVTAEELGLSTGVSLTSSRAFGKSKFRTGGAGITLDTVPAADNITIDGQSVGSWVAQYNEAINKRVETLQEQINSNLDIIDNLEKLRGLDLVGIYKADNPTKEKSGSSKKDKEETWFDRQYKEHQHLMAMDQETTEEYLAWLNTAYQQAYAEGIIDLDAYWKYQEEVYKGYKELGKTVEQYIASIDQYYEALKDIEKIQLRLESLQTAISRSTDENEKINLTKQLIEVYEEQIAATEKLNKIRQQTIRENIHDLEELGFEIEYNAETNELLVKNLDHLNELEADTIGEYETLQDATNALRENTEKYISTLEELNDTNKEDTANIVELEDAIRTAKDEILEYLDAIVEKANDVVESFQSVYDTLTSAAQEFASTGYLSVDSLQSILELGPQYLDMLVDENGQLLVNEESLQKVIAARADEAAAEYALSYARKIALAVENDEIEKLEQLTKLNTDAADSVWGLSYATIATAKEAASAKGIDESYFDRAIANIEKMRSLTDTATSTVAEAYSRLNKDNITQQEGVEKILELTQDLIKHENEQAKDALEKQKKDYKDIIDQKKELIKLTQKQTQHEKTLAEKIREMAKLQTKISQLSLDDSREAAAQRKSLEEELAKLQRDVADEQSDYALDAQTDALDKQYEEFEKECDKEIDYREKSLDSAEKLYRAAIDRINNGWDTLYDELIAWNYDYGSSLEKDIVAAWDAATEAVQKYGSFVNALNGVYGYTDLGSNSAAGQGAEMITAASNLIEKMRKNSISWLTADGDTQKSLAEQNAEIAEQYYKLTGDKLTPRDGAWYRSDGTRLYKLTEDEIISAIGSKMATNSKAWLTAGSGQDKLAADNEKLAARLQSYIGQKVSKDGSGVWWLGGNKLYDMITAQNATSSPITRSTAIDAVNKALSPITGSNAVNIIDIIGQRLGKTIPSSSIQSLYPSVANSVAQSVVSAVKDVKGQAAPSYTIDNLEVNVPIQVAQKLDANTIKQYASTIGSTVVDYISSGFAKRGITPSVVLAK